MEEVHPYLLKSIVSARFPALPYKSKTKKKRKFQTKDKL